MKNIHFIGIKGVGMTPLAIIAKEAGFGVTGCDVAETFITDKALSESGITPEVGFDPAHLDNVDIVITTGAHGGYSNKEVLAAKEKGILTVTQGEAVGMFMEGKLFGRVQKGVSIAGCHGKTTTTAMVATMLQDAGKDPSYIIGTSEIPSLSSPGILVKDNILLQRQMNMQPSLHKIKRQNFFGNILKFLLLQI
jgi:UDP-N-acetylmuramate--alanine ligase